MHGLPLINLFFTLFIVIVSKVEIKSTHTSQKLRVFVKNLNSTEKRNGKILGKIIFTYYISCFCRILFYLTAKVMVKKKARKHIQDLIVKMYRSGEGYKRISKI